MNEANRKLNYIYTYACREDEWPLCALEQRSLFGKDSGSKILESPLQIDPSRSPFITGRLDVIYEGRCLQDIREQVTGLNLMGSSFKVIVDKQHSEDPEFLKIGFEQRRAIEREVGSNIQGTAELTNPDRILGVLILGGRWLFGEHFKNEAVWLRHQKKPQSYSTALSTRVARAVVNIAVPDPEGVSVIDPCCGIGNVLVEALSMGIDIVGRDINPLVTRGARENIAHFGLVGEVTLGAIQDVTASYDVAIIDMPYNLCSVISAEDQLSMLQSAARIAGRVVIITIEPLDSIIVRAGFVIADRCIIRKGMFARQVIVGHLPVQGRGSSRESSVFRHL
ncbi:MAG TPA: RNA methyltransferase [Bacilli bacterium]